MERPDSLEISIVREFTRPIWHRFQKGIRDYALVHAEERIAVCISGGVDSWLLAKCMQRQQRYSKTPFSVEYLALDSGGAQEQLDEFAQTCGIPLHIFKSDAAGERELCAAAKSLGCRKIALAQHFDDIIEGILTGMLYDARIAALLPKAYCRSDAEMQCIRPLCLVREADILAWQAANGLAFFPPDAVSPQQQETRRILAGLLQNSTAVDMNIFRAMENVNLRTVLSYQDGTQQHSFLEDFDRGITNHGTVSGEGRNPQADT